MISTSIPRQLASLSVCFVIAALATSAQSLSFSRADYPSAAGPRAIASADFNRDGAVDLALADNGEKGVTILMNMSGAGRGFVQSERITPMKESVRHLGWALTFGAWQTVEARAGEK